MTALFVLLLLPGILVSQVVKVIPESYRVYFFLLEDCKISQAYVTRIKEISMQYQSDSIVFVGLFPNPVSTAETVQRFQRKYKLPFKCTETGALQKAREFDVRVTPEVVVYDERKAELLYQGRIDNMFEAIGQRRRVVTTSELADALLAIQRNEAIPFVRTEAVGCLLPKL